jgi:hypothetical protein
MNIIVNDLTVNRVELDDFLEGIYSTGNAVDLEEVHFTNLTLRRDKIITNMLTERLDIFEEERMITDSDLLIG